MLGGEVSMYYCAGRRGEYALYWRERWIYTMLDGEVSVYYAGGRGE